MARRPRRSAREALANDALDALGVSMRRDIIRLLAAKPRAVGEIARELPVTRPAISKHLRVLERARLVRFDTEGKRNVYRLDERGLSAAREWFDSFWQEALGRFRLVAENTEKDETG